jgi:hypothetical protein
MSKIRLNLAMRLVLVFLFFFLIFFAVHLSVNGFWSTDDPYYHAKHSLLIAQTGNPTLVLPWIKFHFFAYAPTDPWWGYHVISALFIRLSDVYLGVKTLTAVLGSLVMVVFYFLVERFGAKRPFIWTLLFFFSSSYFQFRLFLERPFVLALSILPLAAWLIHRKKNIWLFFLSLVFALLYNLAALTVFLCGIYMVAEYIITRKVDFRPIIASSAGVLAGILLHPQSFNYLFVIFVHFFEILYLRFSGTNLGIGSEVQSIDFFQTLAYNILAIVVYIAAVALYAAQKDLRKESVFSLFLLLVSGFWFMLMLVVPRAADFWVPFAWLFSISVFLHLSRSQDYVVAKNFITKKFDYKWISLFLIVAFTMLVFNNFAQIAGYRYRRLAEAREDQYWQEVNDWLKANSRKGDIVFYDIWSYWPRMFFYNDYNTYVVGVDPTFLYDYDHKLFWLWFNMTKRGIYCDKQDECPEISQKDKLNLIAPAIKQQFGAEYILVENEIRGPFSKILSVKKDDFTKIYENKKLLIYKVR